MKIKAIAPWFGGKRTLAPAIVRELGPHKQYFEPFCGSMAVLFAKEPSKAETVNDLHGDLVNLAVCLQDEFDSRWLYDRTQRTLVSDVLLQQSKEYFAEMPDEDAIGNRERAYWYFVACWMARNGIAGMERTEYQLAVRWTAGGGSPTVRWRSAVESIPAWHQRLQNVVILNRDALKFMDRFEDAAHTAIYVDPPYIRESRSHGSYKHDFDAGSPMFGDEHELIRDILAGYQHARIVVSYYDCERIRELYDGWTFVDQSRQKNLHAQNGRGSRKSVAPEVLIVNGPSYEADKACRT